MPITRAMTRFLVVALASGLGTVSPAAAAPATDAAVAEALFQEGRQLMTEGKIAQACPKFAESQRLDPATGTLLNLAVCHEAEGKLAMAWAEFNEALTRARLDGRADRETLARQRIEAIEPRLAKLTIDIDRAKQPPDLVVQLDGMVIGPAAWGVATPVDPGAHEVRAAAPGKQAWTARIFVVVPGLRLEVPPLEDERLAPPVAAANAPASSTLLDSAGQGWSTRRKVALGLAGTSAASLAVGSVFGLRAFSRWSDRDRHCPMDRCTAEAVSAGQQAGTAARVSNVAFGVGLGAAAVAAYLFFWSPGHGETPALTLRPIIDLQNPGVGLACGF
jgi:hypothetical protein